MTEFDRFMPEDVLSGIIALFSSVWILCFAIGIFFIVARWRLFKKAGEPGLACIIPFYCHYVFYKIAFGNGWLFLLLLVPFVNIFLALALPFKLAKAFGHEVGYGVGLLFLSNIFIAIMAFDKNEYIGPVV